MTTITVKNYLSEVDKHDQKQFSSELEKDVEFTKENIDLYDDDEDIKKLIDTHISMLNTFLAKQDNNKAQKSDSGKTQEPKKQDKPAKKSTGRKKTGQAKTAKATKKPKKSNSKYDNASLTEKVTEAVRHIKNFVNLQGKAVTRLRLLSLIKSLNKAISERLIRKTCKYAKEIEYVQDKLYDWYRMLGDNDEGEITIEEQMYGKLYAIAYSEKKLLSITYIQQYLDIQGRTSVKTVAKKLKEKIEQALASGKIGSKDPYHAKLTLITESITNYEKDLTTRPELHEAELNGLMGIAGITVDSKPKKKSKVSSILNACCNIKQPAGVISSIELAGMEFETIGLTGQYRELIGDPSVGFSCMVYGKPKSGKSTLCIDFARYLAEHHGKVLFCAIEEGYGYTLKEKLERLKAIHRNLFVSDTVPGNLSQFDFVFVDSVSKGKIDNDRLNELIRKHPKVAFIFIFHSTKGGDFRGGQENAHDVDVIVEVDDGVASGRGRFGCGGEIGVRFG